MSTHVRSLLDSSLGSAYKLVHFQVGSEGRRQSPPARLLRLGLDPWRLAAAILKHRAPVVHLNWSLNAKAYWRDLAHMAVAKLCGARVVFQKHGGELREFAANAVFASFFRATLRWADALVVLSKAELLEYLAFVPGQRVLAVPNGVDPAPLAVSREPRPAGAPLRVLYMGRLARHKGIMETLEALATLRHSGVAPRLTIAGSGPLEKRLRARAAALGLDDGQVVFVGPLHGSAKRAALEQADVMVLASYTEGLPYALLEAMAAGVVPVATPVGAVPELLGRPPAGRLVPMKDPAAIANALLALDRDRLQLARLSAACCRRIADEYTLGKQAADFSRLYGSLLPRPASQPLWPSRARPS